MTVISSGILIASLSSPMGYTLPAIEQLSIEEKVGQVLMVHFHGQEANEEAKTLIQDLHIGGITYYNWANGLTSPHQVSQLSIGLQSLAKIPLLISVDQEGGLVARLIDGWTIFPGNRPLGVIGNTALARESAYAIGSELKSVGVNMNFAPVVDINSNEKNPVIGIRSFGTDRDLVTELAIAALQGYREAGILTTLKHFPGHGDVAVDSHEALPTVKKTKEKLYEEDLYPFIKCAPYADSVMTAHILVPALDTHMPATLSKETLKIVRQDASFEGPIITDSLVMQGILDRCKSVDEAAIQALKAGCDIILLGGKQLLGGSSSLEMTLKDVERIHTHMVRAVQTGDIPIERLNQAVGRIFAIKKTIVVPKRVIGQEEVVATDAHKKLAMRIAQEALCVQTDGSPLDIQSHSVVVIAPDTMQKTIEKTSLPKIGHETSIHYFQGLNPTTDEIAMLVEKAKAVEQCVVCTYNCWKNPLQERLVHTLLAVNKSVVVLILRDPQDANLFGSARWRVITFSPTVPSVQAAVDRLRQ